MKIELSKLKPNPYRDLKKYPIQQERVECLKASIEQTGFWDNILARPSGNHFELAYGHNRLIALQQLGIKQIDIPVKDIPDADMVRIMATENREQYDENQAILIETVQAVRDFLNNELSKSDKWDTSNEFIRCLFESQKAFESTAGRGVGQTTILKFLGKGWKQWKIQHALEVLNSSEINPEAVKQFDTTGMGSAFTKAIKEINKDSKKPVDFKEQMRVAEKLINKIDSKDAVTGKTGGGNYYTAIKDFVKEEVISNQYVKPVKKSEPKRDFIKYESYVAELRNRADEFREDLRRLSLTEKELGDIQDNVQRKLFMMSLNSLLEQIKLLTKNESNEKVKQNNDDCKCITERC